MATERSRTIWRRSICVQSLAPPSLLSNAFNGSTYAGNRFEGHLEIALRGVESVAAGRAGCGSWWRSSACRLKLAMSGVTILAFGCKRCKHTASQPPPQSRLRSTRRDKLPPSSHTPSRPRPPRRNSLTVAAKAILTSRIPALPGYSRVACAHAPLARIYTLRATAPSLRQPRA
jgi:hypothetical protein